MNSVLELLERTGSFVTRTGRRGRPSKAIGELSALHFAIAFDVEALRLKASGAHGSLAAAVRLVARKHRLPHAEEMVKMTWRRRADARATALLWHRMAPLLAEAERRMTALPEDVKAVLMSLPPDELVSYLRERGIDCTAPNSVIHSIRRWANSAQGRRALASHSALTVRTGRHPQD